MFIHSFTPATFHHKTYSAAPSMPGAGPTSFGKVEPESGAANANPGTHSQNTPPTTGLRGSQMRAELRGRRTCQATARGKAVPAGTQLRARRRLACDAARSVAGGGTGLASKKVAGQTFLGGGGLQSGCGRVGCEACKRASAAARPNLHL